LAILFSKAEILRHCQSILMDYQIIHNVPGRIRILIPQLATDPDYVQRLQGLVESIEFVTEARINPWAQSLVVSYKIRIISSEAIQKHLFNAIEQADSSATVSSVSQEKPTATYPPSVSEPVSQEKSTPTYPPLVSEPVSQEKSTPTYPPLVSEPAIEQEKSNEASEAILEEEHLTTVAQKFAIEEDPWEADLKSDSTSPSVTEPADEEIMPLKHEEIVSIETPPAMQSEPESKEQKEALSSLSTAALAKRLQVASQTLTRNRSKPNFVEWTQAKDPEGVAWHYDLKSKTFYRVISPTIDSNTS
jgi:Heavy metal associated domain 2